MTRPSKATKKRAARRSSTAIRFPVELHAALTAAAADRDVSVNWLVNRAVEDYLPRLIPANELRWTRES